MKSLYVRVMDEYLTKNVPLDDLNELCNEEFLMEISNALDEMFIELQKDLAGKIYSQARP